MDRERHSTADPVAAPETVAVHFVVDSETPTEQRQEKYSAVREVPVAGEFAVRIPELMAGHLVWAVQEKPNLETAMAARVHWEVDPEKVKPVPDSLAEELQETVEAKMFELELQEIEAADIVEEAETRERLKDKAVVELPKGLQASSTEPVWALQDRRLEEAIARYSV